MPAWATSKPLMRERHSGAEVGRGTGLSVVRWPVRSGQASPSAPPRGLRRRPSDSSDDEPGARSSVVPPIPMVRTANRTTAFVHRRHIRAALQAAIHSQLWSPNRMPVQRRKHERAMKSGSETRETPSDGTRRRHASFANDVRVTAMLASPRAVAGHVPRRPALGAVGWRYAPAGSGGVASATAVAPGSRIVNRVPRPGWLATVTVPLWASTTYFTMASPRPLPPDRRERAESTR